MALGSDGNISSSVVLRSMRDRLVDYGEALLRQLVDERNKSLGAIEHIKSENAGKDNDDSVAEKEIAEKVHGGTEVGTLEIADDGANVSCSTLQKVPGTTNSEHLPAIEEVEDAVMLSKKRRLAESATGSVKKAKQTEATMQQQLDETAASNCKKDDVQTSTNDVNVAQQQECSLEGATCRVARLSAPPTKYLMQKQQEEDESDRESFTQKQSFSLSASPVVDQSTSNGLVDVKRPLPSSRSPPISKLSTGAEFEKTLRECVRLQRKVHKRGLAVMRKRHLPRVRTPARGKAHWDFLLEEMKWMAADFSQERNWKQVMQHRLAADAIAAQNADSLRLEQANRQLARGVALQISAFWRTMERIAARSRVRFETTGADTYGDIDDLRRGKFLADDGKQDKSDDTDMADNKDCISTMKYLHSDVPKSKSNGKGDGKPEVVALAKSRITYIVSAGKRARSAMTSSSTACADSDKSSLWSTREAAFRDLQARCKALQAKGGPAIILASFQLLALRWMLDLYLSGLNMFLNDQLGMGKATTIVAFLSLIEIVTSRKQQQQQREGNVTSADIVFEPEPRGPHLIIVSGEELHKWRYFLRIWHPGRRIQHYDGVNNTRAYREKLQREWKTKPRAFARNKDDSFLISPSSTDDDDESDDGEGTKPVYCVLCPVSEFAEHWEAFIAFTGWQMVIVENEHDRQFNDLTCISAMQQLRQQQRRVLCNSQSIENWANTALRLRYAEFLVQGISDSIDTDGIEDSVHSAEVWQDLLVERASVAEVLQHYGKSSSGRASLWKACSQDKNPQFMNVLLLALSCLSLRRVRSKVESELGKVEETSMSCQLSSSQKSQYHNIINGFIATLDTSSGREERISVWLQLLLRLREICNCVDVVNDMDKLGNADMRLLTSCSAKLEVLEPLIRRLALQEGKKVVIYSQFNTMLPILELFLSLLDISCVRVTGSIAMQRRALCHFANRPAIRVALVSTRLSMLGGRRAVSVFGGEAIVVVDSDWNATCDAKLRASWAKMAVGGADTLPVYRLYCENTIEASLLRVGASLTEKVFGEMSPLELLVVPSDMAARWTIEKPSWWSSTATSSGGSSGTGAIANLARVAQQVEKEVKYCGDINELEAPLDVHNVDLDADEHLLLANTDELTPVEWYAVNFVHGVNDKKVIEGGDGKAIEIDAKTIKDEGSITWNESNTSDEADERSFEKLALVEVNRHWQDGSAASTLFFYIDSHDNGTASDSALERLFMQMRMEGMETHFDVYKPPQPPIMESSKAVYLSFEPLSIADSQMTFRAFYRVPAPPPPAPLLKSKLDHFAGHHEELSKFNKSNKKQRTNMTATRAGTSGVASESLANAVNSSAGVKRKLESQLSGIKTGHKKEMRVDLEGIPVPDVSEFADDDFWGDTNLDALDSAEWDDSDLFGGILGVGVGGAGSAASSASQLSTGATSAMSGVGGSTTSGGAQLDSGHLKTGSQKSSKKSKTGTGRARKSSLSSSDFGRDAWSVHDDIILKKLFELYGANWTLVAQVLNSSAAISRFVSKKRSPRQCYDRYNKLMSGGLANSTFGGSATTKDAKSGSSSKAQRAAAMASMATTKLSPAVLDVRIGLPPGELLVKLPHRHSLPGVPPPSVVSAVDMSFAYKKAKALGNLAAAKQTFVGADELKSIKTSFDAIIQCMKHKTAPPPIPIPAGVGSTSLAPTATPARSSSSDLDTKASLTATSFLPIQSPPLATVSAPVATTARRENTTLSINATASSAATVKAMPVVVPPPHKSHTDMVSLLPTAVLGPDEVIKRSKEAAVVAVQAAAAVASVGRDGSPLSASGDVMLGAGSGFDASVNASIPRRSHAASLTNDVSAVSAIPPSSTSPTASTTGAALPQATTAATTAAWGGTLGQANRSNAGASMELNGTAVPGGSEVQRAPMPVTTSTLLHVLDRMPEIKNKIQSILNRTDCSESQKVAMIARLLSNTNAINNTNAPTTAPSNSNAVLSALTADAGLLSSSDMLIDTETPIPMPASLAASSPPNVASSSALASQEQFQSPPASSKP